MDKSFNGGFFKELSEEVVQNWVSPNVKENDCCPCVFKMLDIVTDDELVYLLENFGDNGMTGQVLLGFLSDKYPDYDFSYFSADFRRKTMEEKKGLLLKIFSSIKRGYGVVGGITRINGSKHCVVFSKDKRGGVAIFDSQFNKSYLKTGGVMQFLNENRVMVMHLITSGHKEDDEPLSIDEDGVVERYYDYEEDVYYDAEEGYD